MGQDLGNGFDYHPRTRMVFGAGRIERVGELAGELGGGRVLLVTDPGIVEAGHSARAMAALEAAGLKVAVFDGVIENPTTREVDQCVATARSAEIDVIVGLGGGSSLDTAKGCNFLLSNGGRMQDYWGMGKAKRAMLPLIAIPTTAGTGSECQSYALITDEGTHQKMACGDPKAAATVAILDPELTLTQPHLVTVDTGIDAIAHAVESAVTKKRNALSTLFSREGFRLTATSFGHLLNDPDNVELRAQMQLGAAFGGMAIENSMLGAAHAAANPLTARYNVVHGQAVGLMLPAVIRYNRIDGEASSLYANLAVAAGIAEHTDDEQEAIDALVARIQSLWEGAELPASLEAHGVEDSGIEELAALAAQQWTRQHNPREIGEEGFVQLYRSVLASREVKGKADVAGR